MVMKWLLLGAAATVALATAPAVAQSDDPEGSSITYNNNIDTSVVTDVNYHKWVGLFGYVRLHGDIDVDSSAVAVNDAKQLQEGVAVTYREENELNGENGYVDALFGPGWSEAGNDPNDDFEDGIMEPQIRAGYFAPIINTIGAYDVDGSGNIGLNMAAGYFNDQLNSAVIASSMNDDEEASGGWAEASTTSLQNQLGVAQYASPSDILPEDDPEEDGGGNNFRDRNRIAPGTVTGSGNIGVNAAAGSLNQQANLMTVAVADNAVLAEANAGLIQHTALSFVEQQDSQNLVGGPTVTGSGNVGINLAAGVGNQQLNSLTIAASQGGAANGGNGNGNGNGDGS